MEAERASGTGVVWMTGLSASGKSTLSSGLCDRLVNKFALEVTLIDGEHMRERLPRAYGHSLEDREAVLRHIVDEADRILALGQIAVVATISHTRQMRAFARQRLAPFLEVFLDCAAEHCAARDRKGHYARARRGEYAVFIGVTHPYERWVSTSDLPEFTFDTHAMTPTQCLDQLERQVSRAFRLTPR
ncbi:MAG: adenylyl-sulfate kinase, partial [Pseudomonadota bacterium]